MSVNIKKSAQKAGALLVAFTIFVMWILGAVVICQNANAQSAFTPRLTEPESDNEYYYSDKNVFYKYGYPMPNCTAYAFGRVYEILGKEPSLSHNAAQRWFTDNEKSGAYKTGNTPKLGAVACWKYEDGGHVAVVEEITDTTITFSNSGYGYKNFYLTTASITDANPGQSNWTFQGYIYVCDTENGEQLPPVTGDKYLITSDNGVNLRDKPSSSGEWLSAIPYNTVITVTNTTQADGYTWGFTSYDNTAGWCVLDFAQKLTPDSTEPTTQTPEETTPQTSVPDSDILGDTNGDGRLSISDATLIQYKLADRVQFTDAQMKNADFDKNGKVDVSDVTAIQKKLAS